MMKFLKKYWMSIAICMVILYLCFMNSSDIPKVEINNFDKLVHMIMFMGVSGIVYFENSNYFRSIVSNQKLFLGSFLLPVLYSGWIEIIQEYFSSTRTGDWMDFLFDSMGALIGLIFCLAINKKIKIRTENRKG